MKKVSLILITLVVSVFAAMMGFRCKTNSTPPDHAHGDSTALIRLRAVQGLHYDVVRFRVKPGQDLRITLINTDDMDHNLVFATPGKRKEVLASALELGAKGPEKHYIPASPEVLWHTAILKPGDSQTIAFKAPAKKGVYPYLCTLPGHGITMYGAMYVTDDPLPQLRDDPNIPNTQKQPTSGHHHEPAKERLHPYEVEPPYVVRTFMPDCGPAAIVVSLPDSLSYCWDAGTCCLRYAWSGPFMSKVDLWQRKGDEVARIGGKVFFQRRTDYAWRLAETKGKPRITFKGYTLVNGYPEFHYQMNDLDVYELIKPKSGGTGIDCHFRIPRAEEPMTFSIGSSAHVSLEASTGKWIGSGLLELSADKARHFTISITKN